MRNSEPGPTRKIRVVPDEDPMPKKLPVPEPEPQKAPPEKAPPEKVPA